MPMKPDEMSHHREIKIKEGVEWHKAMDSHRKDIELTSQAKKHGFTLAEFLSFKARPCQICGIENEPTHIDHNHTTLRVRGNLCSKCNTRLGRFENGLQIPDKAWLAKAYGYLAYHGDL